MHLHLVDTSEALVREWRHTFDGFPNVAVEQGDILKSARTALVSPANSYGYMDGGIDLHYRHFFGVQIEHVVQRKIKDAAGPYLPVGQAVVVNTGHPRIPWLVTAPTMFLPEPIDAEACYQAMLAALTAAKLHGEAWDALYCPGMGTGIGRVPPRAAAQAMARAYLAAFPSTPPSQ